MKSTLVAILISAVLLAGCGEPKTYKLNRMHAINPSGTFFVEGSIQGIGMALTEFKAGDQTYTNLTLQDDTGQYTFYFLPSAHARQPAVGDKVKLSVRFVVLNSSFAGGGRAPIIEKFEIK